MVILFVDDDLEDTEIFCEGAEYLNRSDYLSGEKERIECMALNDGGDIIEFLSELKHLPHYIFVDINMPGTGGKECLMMRKASEQFAHIPVVMFSTAIMPSQIDEFKLLGAYDCIQKPSRFNELVKVLSKYVFGKLL